MTEQDVFSGVLLLFHCGSTAWRVVHAAGGCGVCCGGFKSRRGARLHQGGKVHRLTGLPMMYAAALLADLQFRCDDTLRLCIYAMALIPKLLISADRRAHVGQRALATGRPRCIPAP